MRLRFTGPLHQAGIENWFNAITAINAMNYRINVSNADIKLQNTGSTPLVISGARIFRSDGTSVLHADAGDQPMTQDNLVSCFSILNRKSIQQ